MELFSTANIYLLFFICIVFIGIHVVLRWHITALKKFELIVTYLGGISVLLTAFNMYLTIKSNNQIKHNRLAYNTLRNIQNNYLQPQYDLVKHFPESYFLYTSMNPDTPFTQPAPATYDAAKRKEIELYGSLRIFQTIEDFIETAPYESSNISTWLNVFLRWMQSPILQAHWRTMAPSFSHDTQQLVDLLIEKTHILAKLRKERGSLTRHDYNALSEPIAHRYA